MTSSFFSPINNKYFLYKKLNSKFYSFMYSISSSDDIKKQLNQLKQKYSDASHICYAYRLFNGFNLLNEINTNDFSTDSGEPRGSSGPPILRILKKYNMINTSIFVVRYFGGKKLGIPGLIEAYSESANNLISQNNLQKWFPIKTVSLVYPYNIEGSLNNLFKAFNIKIKKQDYQDYISSIIEINIYDIDDFVKKLSDFPACSIKEA